MSTNDDRQVTIDLVKEEIVNAGKDPNDFNISISDNITMVTPKWFAETKWIAKDVSEPIRKASQIATKKMIVMDELTPEEMDELIDVFDDWEVGRAFRVGDVLTYQGQFFEVIQAHTSQSDWTPDTVPALFKSHAPAGVIPEWQQPTGGHDAYSIGDKVMFEGKVYESVIDANTWSPTGYPAGWQEVV